MFLLLAITIVGCNGKKNASPAGTAGTTTSSDEAAAAVVSLDSCMAELQPNEFGINVPVELPLSALNEWADADLADRLDPLVDEDVLREDLAVLLDDTAVERVLRRRFVIRDVTHARDTLWAQQTVSNVRTGGADAESRITALFYHTVHTIRLVPDTADRLPLGPFESAKFGVGTVDDRAWVFGTLLNTLQVPSAIITLPESEADAAAVRLVGVLLEGRIYLYDVALGLPVPAADAETHEVLPQTAASFAEALADDDVLRQLDTEDAPYPVTAKRLKSATLNIIGDTTLWSRRMEGLSEALTGDLSVPVYRPLVSAGDQDGTYDLIRDAVSGQISSENIGVWPFPEARREARARLTDEQKTQFAELDRPFQTPYPIVQVGPESVVLADQSQIPKLTVGNGWRNLLEARISQLQGDTADAIALYTRVQSWKFLPFLAEGLQLPPDLAIQFDSGSMEVKGRLSYGLPEVVRRAQFQAGEVAQLWRGHCQLEKRNWEAASRDFENYLRQNPRSGLAVQARYLGAVAYAFAGDYRRASSFLRYINEDAPEYRAAQLLITRWATAEEKTN